MSNEHVIHPDFLRIAAALEPCKEGGEVPHPREPGGSANRGGGA